MTNIIITNLVVVTNTINLPMTNVIDVMKTPTSGWEITSAIGSILVPIVLALWAWYSEHRKEIEQQKKEELESIKIYYENNIFPILSQFQESDSDTCIKHFTNLYNKLIALPTVCNLKHYSQRSTQIVTLIHNIYQLSIRDIMHPYIQIITIPVIKGIDKYLFYSYYNDIAFDTMKDICDKSIETLQQDEISPLDLYKKFKN